MWLAEHGVEPWNQSFEERGPWSRGRRHRFRDAVQHDRALGSEDLAVVVDVHSGSTNLDDVLDMGTRGKP